MQNRKNNELELIVDGHRALMTILRCIRSARHSIRIRMYMWRDDECGRKVLQALAAKIRKNPRIKIFIEKDRLGSRIYNLQKVLSWSQIGGDIFSSPNALNFLKNNPQVHFTYRGSRSLLFFKYLKENDHSKVFLFDEKSRHSTVLIGGMNIGNEYLMAPNHLHPEKSGWHDYMVLLKGDLTESFLVHQAPPKKKWLVKKILQKVEIILDIKNRRRIKHQILEELSSARRSIIVEHGYITDSAIIRRLRHVSRKGVEVRVIMPDQSDGFYNANMRSIHKLLKPTPFTRKKSKKLKVFLYRGMIHAKVILIDKTTAILGSANLTRGSFDLVSETTAIFRQKNKIALQLLKQLEKDLRYCSPITLESLPPYKHWLAWLEKIFI